MAICFAEESVVSAGWPDDEDQARGERGREAPARGHRRASSAVAAAAYQGRRRMTSVATGKTYDHRHNHGRVLYRAVLLPKHAHAKFRVSGHLWSEAERAELVFDRKARTWRFRRGAVLARKLKLALPKELTLKEQIRLLRRFVQQEFTNKGVAVEVAIHPSDDPQTGNVHAHVLVTSRRIYGDRFAKKRATDLAPDFAFGKGRAFIPEKSRWPQRWTEAQNRFFATHGIPLQVDPISPVPRVHIGPTATRFERGQRVVQPPSRAQEARIHFNQALAEQETKVLRDPAELLRRVAERVAVFDEAYLVRILRKAGIVGMAARKIVHDTLTLPDVVAIDPPSHPGIRPPSRPAERFGRRRFTTRTILEQELQVRANIRQLGTLPRRVPDDVRERAEELISERGLDPEQANAVRHCLNSDGVAVVQGRAGTGKSYASIVVADAFAESHFEVIGLAPTNAVVGNMRKDGYKTAMTLHRFLKEVESGNRVLGSLHVLMVDEAAMVDMDIYQRLTTAAVNAGCFLFLVGDDRQLQAVGRGGAYSMIRRTLGEVELSNVRRQRTDWMREASRRLSEWDIAPAIKAYNSRGHITWARSEARAKGQLVEDWRRAIATNPEQLPFVYAGTRAAVKELNERLQAVRWDRAPASPVHTFKTDNGDVSIRVGERLRFAANDARAKLFNGTLATVTKIDTDSIHVRCDDGTETWFDPGNFTTWALGYSGTCYAGQGRTQNRVLLYYDHPFVWHAATTYVGLTRHRDHVQLYVPRDLAADEETLIRQMSRTMEPLLASDLIRVDPKQSNEDIAEALYPIEPEVRLSLQWKGAIYDFELGRKKDRDAAARLFERTEVDEFVRNYKVLQDLAAMPAPPGGPECGRAELVRREVVDVARTRGFRADSGEVDCASLQGVLEDEELDALHNDRCLDGKRAGEIDVRWVAFQPAEVDFNPWMKVMRRLRQLDAFVLDAFLKRIHNLRKRAYFDEALSGALGLAAYMVKISKAIAHGDRDATWPRRRRAIHAQEPAPRLVWEPFRLWRDDPVDGPVRMQFRRRAEAVRSELASLRESMARTVPAARSQPAPKGITDARMQ